MELCEETIEREGDHGKCAKLKNSFYGTKPAAQKWQQTVRRLMTRLNFRTGKSPRVVLYHKARYLRCLVHGDDFVASGPLSELIQLRNQIENELEVATTIMGEDASLAKDIKILGRRRVWPPGVGISYGADPRRARVLIKDTGAEHTAPLRTPIVKERSGDTRGYG